MLEEAKKEIGRFYPNDVIERKGYFGETGEEYIPVGYIWARTIPCQNPACGAEIPLMRQFWLAKKDKKRVALYPYVEGKEVKFKIVGDGYEPMPKDFDPSKGTVKGAKVTCLVCGMTIDANEPIPDEPTPEGKGRGAERDFSVGNCGLNTWGDLFNSRQKLALVTFVDKVREAYRKMVEEGYDKEYAKAVVTYLALAVDKLADHNSTLCVWVTNSETNAHPFMRNSMGMTWVYSELMPFGTLMGCWHPTIDWFSTILLDMSFEIHGNAFQSSATELLFRDNYFDAVLTDPPYYDNVSYSYLSDFYYVWLKRAIGDLYPELFSTPLTPKSKEIVAYTNNKSWEESKRYFEEMLKQSFKEIHRVLFTLIKQHLDGNANQFFA